MNIVLLGGPGSGKGTVSNLLEKTQNIGHIATGDMFREEIKNETVAYSVLPKQARYQLRYTPVLKCLRLK